MHLILSSCWKNMAYTVLFLFFCVCIQQCVSENFCNQNLTMTFETPCTKCYLNYRTRCPPGAKKLTMGRGDATCYVKVGTKREYLIRGCQHKCAQPVEIKKCCPGYWGIDCEACPIDKALSVLPCSGRGVCNDTVEGNGQCNCQESYSGYACEKCQNETMFGPKCDQECQCVNGRCDHGVKGDGSCDCNSGYNGTLCDQELEECKNKTCPENSRCLDVYGWVMCTCNEWYRRIHIYKEGNDTEVTSSTQCVPVDVCKESKTDCHENSTCSTTGPGTYNCTCIPGYHGDGYVCDPIDPCQEDNGGCDTNTTECQYTGPGQHTCKCIRGYEKDLKTDTCRLIDVCSWNSSYCSEFATCSVIGPFQMDCTCNEGYGGDGTTCYNNIADLIGDLNSSPDKTLNGKMNFASRLISTHYYEELRNSGPFTLFIAVDSGFRTVIGKQSFERFLADEDTARQVLRQHIIVGEWTLEKLATLTEDICTLQGICADIQAKEKNGEILYRYKLKGGATKGASKTTVQKGNIMAANGIVHIIGKMLTKQPEIDGDKQKSMLELIKKDDGYSTLETFIENAGLSDVVRSGNITMFTPSDSAWLGIPPTALKYFSSPEGIPSLREIINHHIFDGIYEAAELIEIDRIRSRAGVEVPVNVNSKGQIILNGNISLEQTDIPAKNGLYHHISSVMLPGHINSLLPSQCDEEVSEIVVGPCGPCMMSDDLTCPEPTDVPLEGEVRTGCTYSIYSSTQTGCSQVCNRTHIKHQCCPNFYSIDCHQCPGGFQNTCSGNGQCLDGVDGNGTCICDPGFTGTNCEQCSDPNKFGPYCNQTCSCVRGTCKNYIDSDGTCSSCTSDRYSGVNCDLVLMYCHRNMFKALDSYCHMRAYCDSSFKCKCKNGYEGVQTPSHLSCVEIDNCQLPDRGGCDLQAECVKTGPGENICRCETGYVGDGKYCYESIQCDSHRDCHADARCRAHWTKTQTLCECKNGYHGNGTFCAPNDPCNVNNGNCHKNARCITLGLMNHTCTCLPGYLGNGFMCSPTIYKVVEGNPSLSKLAAFLNKSGDDDLLLSTTQNSTLFAPNDAAMEMVMSRMDSSYWEDKTNVVNFIRFHVLPGMYSTKMLLSYQKSHVRMETLYDGFSLSVFNFDEQLLVGAYRNSKLLSVILKPDIPAVNGYVHVISKALEPFFPPSDTPMLDEFLMNHPEYSLFSDWLEARDMVDKIISMPQYTLFIPTNDALKGHNISFVKSRYLQFYILPKIRLLSSFENGETVWTDLGASQQVKITKIGRETYVNDVLISAPNMMTAGGVIHGIDGLLSPVLHQCNITDTSTVFSKCRTCSLGYYTCPEGYQPVDRLDLLQDCYYPYTDGYSRKGCRGLCQKKTLVPECCQGYYGPNCRECPGGAEFPCNNNGGCMTGINGTGQCFCLFGFNGTSCEYKDVNGSLVSWGMTCLYNNGGCSPNATCEETLGGRVRCTCFPGLVGDGSQCDNPCDSENGGCHDNADCIFIEGYGRNCSCMAGYEGDGIILCIKSPEALRSSAVLPYIVSVLVVVLLIAVVVFLGVYFYWKQYKMSGMAKMLSFSRYGKSRSSLSEPLQPDDKDNEALVSQPSTPDVNFYNPLYDVKEEFNDM